LFERGLNQSIPEIAVMVCSGALAGRRRRHSTMILFADFALAFAMFPSCELATAERLIAGVSVS
jgi:hypothetical protein